MRTWKILDKRYDKIMKNLRYILKLCGINENYIDERLDNNELSQVDLDSALMELIETIREGV